MKTLITVSNSNLKKVIFNRSFYEKLSSVSDIHFVEEDKIYKVDDLSRDIGDYDICITSWGSPQITPEVLNNAKKLKFVGHAAGSVAHYIDPRIFALNIVLVNANTGLVRSTAESTLAMMLSSRWDLFGFRDRLKLGHWTNLSSMVNSVYNQVIGLIGLGEISKELIRLLQPLNPRILLNSEYCSETMARKMGVTLVSLDELLVQSDIISVHHTLTDETRGMIGKRELQLIQDGALLVNTARAQIFREEELLDALREGRFQAILDVFHKEPLKMEDELLKLENVICLPHIGGVSRYWKTRLGEMVASDLQRWMNNEPLSGLITEEKYWRQTMG